MNHQKGKTREARRAGRIDWLRRHAGFWQHRKGPEALSGSERRRIVAGWKAEGLVAPTTYWGDVTITFPEDR